MRTAVLVLVAFLLGIGGTAVAQGGGDPKIDSRCFTGGKGVQQCNLYFEKGTDHMRASFYVNGKFQASFDWTPNGGK